MAADHPHAPFGPHCPPAWRPHQRALRMARQPAVPCQPSQLRPHLLGRRKRGRGPSADRPALPTPATLCTVARGVQVFLGFCRQNPNSPPSTLQNQTSTRNPQTLRLLAHARSCHGGTAHAMVGRWLHRPWPKGGGGGISCQLFHGGAALALTPSAEARRVCRRHPPPPIVAAARRFDAFCRRAERLSPSRPVPRHVPRMSRPAPHHVPHRVTSGGTARMVAQRSLMGGGRGPKQGEACGSRGTPPSSPSRPAPRHVPRRVTSRTTPGRRRRRSRRLSERHGSSCGTCVCVCVRA